MFDARDRRYMKKALALAEKGIGLASPNPSVGCVIVRENRIVGSGFHEYDMMDHAEIRALRQAAGRLHNATAYVTLEPCCHQGRIPPCANRLVVVGEAGDGRDAIEMISQDECDVVVLDLGLPGLSGLDVLQILKAKYPSLPIIVMSIHTEEEYAVMVVKAGGSGYLTKESVPEVLIKAIRKAVRGETYVSEPVSALLVDELRNPSHKRLHERLSSMEYRVFFSIIKGKSIKEISHELRLARPTVSTYRTRVLQKMNMSTNVELARYAAKHRLDE